MQRHTHTHSDSQSELSAASGLVNLASGTRAAPPGGGGTVTLMRRALVLYRGLPSGGVSWHNRERVTGCVTPSGRGLKAPCKVKYRYSSLSVTLYWPNFKCLIRVPDEDIYVN